MSSSLENTKSELQRTVSEVVRVLIYRRWSFFVPFCIAATAVFVSSHDLPRVYQAATSFERRNTIAIAPVMGRDGPAGINALRRNMLLDITSDESMLGVADQLGLTENLPRDSEGRLTEAGKLQRQGIANGLKGALSYRLDEAAPDGTVDSVTITATGSDPDFVVRLVNAARDTCFQVTKSKYLSMLQEARNFYLNEIEIRLQEIDRYEEQMNAMEAEFPFVDNKQNVVSDQLFSSRLARDELKRKIDDYQREIPLLEARLKAMPVTKLVTPQTALISPDMIQTKTDMEAERVRLRNQILQIQNQMSDLRIDRKMLDRHPTMQSLLRREAMARRDLEILNEKLGNEEPEKSEETVFTDDPLEVAIKASDRERVVAELAAKKSALMDAQNELQSVERILADHELKRSKSVAKRPEYRSMQVEFDALKSGVQGLRNSERQLAQVLDIDQKDQGMEFITTREADTSRRPILPKTKTIVMLALGVGLAFGACLVFLREFFDHTFHTNSAVSSALGVQILEGIDEILLPADRRRYFLKRIVALPLAGILAAVLSASGGLAYLSVEDPPLYKKIVHKASVTWQELGFKG